MGLTISIADTLNQSIPPGPPFMDLPIGYDHLPEQQREIEAERQQREEELRVEREEFQQQQGEELRDFLNRPREEHQTLTEVWKQYLMHMHTILISSSKNHDMYFNSGYRGRNTCR